MSSSGGGRGAWFGGTRWGLVLLPLALGIAIGAFMFESFGNFGWGGNERGSVMRSEGRRSAAQPDPGATAPQADARPVAPVAGEQHRDGPRGMLGRRGPGFGFWRFGGMGLLLPLAMIAGGAWLLAGPRRPGGGGAPPTPPSGTPPVDPAARVYDVPRMPGAPPSEGETRRL